MVRVNLLDPRALADQHLVAEYDEILMLFGYVRRYPVARGTGARGIPPSYRLGKGHILFFKDKLSYLKRRHELLKKEMRRRGFVTRMTIDLHEYPKQLRNDWKPSRDDCDIIKKRLYEKLRKKPDYYRYEGEHKPLQFFLKKIESAGSR